MTSAQLDNEKQTLIYQVELLKDQLEEQEESFIELTREYKDKSRVSTYLNSACLLLTMNLKTRIG